MSTFCKPRRYTVQLMPDWGGHETWDDVISYDFAPGALVLYGTTDGGDNQDIPRYYVKAAYPNCGWRNFWEELK